MSKNDYSIFECPLCEWEGEGIFLTEDGECPACYALLLDDNEKINKEKKDEV